jgi:hypothetical protein
MRRWVSGCRQTTDLAVGGSNPSRRATKPAGQWPYGWVADCSGTAGLRPNCDHVGGHSLSDCDHLRPPWLMPAPLLLVSARRGGASQRSAVGAALSTSTSGPAHRSARLLSVGGFEPTDGLGAPPHAGVARAARTAASVALGRPSHGKDGVAGSIPAGGSTSKGNRGAHGIGAPARHRGLIRGHGG